MQAAVILLPFLLSCGPEECKDLEFFVDRVLEEEEDLWQATLKVYRKCEGACDATLQECMELATGVPDPLDTGFVPPTEEECSEDYEACEAPCVHPEELDYPYTKPDSPVVSWTGEGLTVLSIVIAKGPKKDDVVWSVKCPKEDNCLTSPVVYGEVPPGAELNKKACKDEKCDTDQRTLLTDGQVYKASGARDEGGC